MNFIFFLRPLSVFFSQRLKFRKLFFGFKNQWIGVGWRGCRKILRLHRSLCILRASYTRVCNMHIMHIKSTSEAVSRTSYWLSANQDSIARSHYAEARSQVSPRLARLFAVLLVDLVRNVRDGKSLHRSSLPSSMDTRDV